MGRQIPIYHDEKLPALGVTMPTAHTHATARVAEHTAGEGSDMARKGGKPKVHAVPVNSGMHSRTREGSLVVGVTQTQVNNAPDASGKAPLDPTQQGKTLTTPQTVIGHRSRVGEVQHAAPGVNHARGRGVNHDLGQAILDEAFSNSSADDCRAHGRC
jgi:hypothetical protein